jgi:hypothetical protein
MAWPMPHMTLLALSLVQFDFFFRGLPLFLGIPFSFSKTVLTNFFLDRLVANVVLL